MLLNSPSGTEFIANLISPEWEPIYDGTTLQCCLDGAMEMYSMTIADEINFDKKRKVLALEVEVISRIQPRAEPAREADGELA
ncbi:hypothetical protein [Xanthomonas campestris]|uniref:hypothetical protein n=1 Tax=Xanthomonas campestris TaxID=339 RepID=UPI0023E9CEAB|nr:hypothetical protein [Xanthomonas campestris]